MTSDHALLQATAAGDLASFEALYARYSDRVYRFALAMASSVSIAEDATQETFVQIMQSADAFDSQRSDSAIGWIYGLCRNQLRPLLRNRRRLVPHNHTEADGPGTSIALADTYEWNLSAEVIAQAMQSLSFEQREVLTLCGLQELDYQTAATILNCPVGTVRSRLSRSRDALRCALTTHTGRTLEEIGTDVR